MYLKSSAHLLFILFILVVGGTAHAAVDATAAALEAIAADINAPDGAGLRQCKQRLKPLLADPDPEVRGRAFVLYGQLVRRRGTPVEQEQVWIVGREHLAEGSDGWRCCTLGLARWQIAHARIEAGAALATRTMESSPPNRMKLLTGRWTDRCGRKPNEPLVPRALPDAGDHVSCPGCRWRRSIFRRSTAGWTAGPPQQIRHCGVRFA